jgi:transposase-like protein
MLRVVTDESTREELASTLDDICREGARRMLAAALELEADEYIAALQHLIDETGRRLVVRNGHARSRTITTAAGAVEIRAPRVNDKRVDPDTGERMKFKSSIVPPWCRKSPKVSEVLPLLYLHGLSTGDFAAALAEFFGTSAGLSPSVITRLTSQWQDEHRAFMNRSLANRDYAVRVGRRRALQRAPRSRPPVLPGPRGRAPRRHQPDVAGGGEQQELVAIADGYLESTDSWADLLRDLKRRGMRPPVVAVGDGALGFWAALRDVWPETREQRDWVHQVANVLDALPNSAQPTAKKMLARDPRRRGPPARRRRREALRRRVAAEVAQGRRQDRQRPGPATHVLRLPGRALAPPEDVQPDRVDLLHRPAAHQGHQGPQLTSRRLGDGVQTHRVRPGPLASGQRAAPSRPRAYWRHLQEGGTAENKPTEDQVAA